MSGGSGPREGDRSPSLRPQALGSWCRRQASSSGRSCGRQDPLGPGWRDFASGSERNRSENGGRIRSVAGLEPASRAVVNRAGTGSRDLEVSAKRRPPQGQAVRRPADRARRQSPRTRSSTGLYGEEAAESYTVRNAQIRRSPPDALCRSCPVRAATDRCHRRPALAQ